MKLPSTWRIRAAIDRGRAHPDVFRQPKAKRVEFRPPDPSANPYLAFAAMMMPLGWHTEQIDPGDPLDKDIYDLSPEEMKNVPSMPGSLEEALLCMEDDHNSCSRATCSLKN